MSLPMVKSPNQLQKAMKEENNVSALTQALADKFGEEVYSTSHGRKMPFREVLAGMVAELLVNGETVYVDGQTFTIEDFDDWLKLATFAFSHLQSATTPNVSANAQAVTLVKVYAGFDPDKI